MFLEFSACASHPCRHHGTCSDEEKTYKCTCSKYYNGINCGCWYYTVIYLLSLWYLY